MPRRDMYAPRINLVRLMKPCFPVFRCSRDPHCRVRGTAGSTKRKSCTRVVKLFRALGRCEKTKRKNGPRCTRNRLIIRLFVGGSTQRRPYLHRLGERVAYSTCLPIPFGGRSSVNYSHDALRRIYTARSWRSSRMNRPKWIRCMNAFLFRLFKLVKRRDIFPLS